MKHLTSHPQRHRQRGFTLVELLITSVIMGLIIATGSNVMVTQIRVSAQQESVRRLEDHWGRINHLLESEITESASATAVANTSLTLTLSGGQTVTYAFDAGTLTRTGPPINDDGTLNLSAENIASDMLTNVDAFQPTITNSREPAYTLSLNDGRGTTYTGLSSSSRSRTSSYP
ncbi:MULTISPECIES: type II secretion system protein J [unclassified Cyanobium]|uniref:PulJ/GspJ family protein n=1 Tax=unclassified Cyanobium TaxID=2627006 RepID=UPI0020CC2EF2|nr:MULTISPECIES: prepilin-type N-terminal cleavage/methylation domain-containing protein [unclassified Cyanobium]MCP9860832.1 prepilin-type N-terminal cleavage/methylation domain-containing protein [Cyanobium sp. Cruz-8H5]MCP9868057.1 prepilin-type N-terminal cleavage/methylation domain-containing protein [Cyanobium sp. Cruz-8D1]